MFAGPIDQEHLENLEDLIEHTEKLKTQKLEKDADLKESHPKLYMASKLNEAV